ncbi:MAG: hypothetical protein ACN4G0_14075 [Polyangiales bacterium]
MTTRKMMVAAAIAALISIWGCGDDVNSGDRALCEMCQTVETQDACNQALDACARVPVQSARAVCIDGVATSFAFCGTES